MRSTTPPRGGENGPISGVPSRGTVAISQRQSRLPEQWIGSPHYAVGMGAHWVITLNSGLSDEKTLNLFATFTGATSALLRRARRETLRGVVLKIQSAVFGSRGAVTFRLFRAGCDCRVNRQMQFGDNPPRRKGESTIAVLRNCFNWQGKLILCRNEPRSRPGASAYGRAPGRNRRRRKRAAYR